MNTTNPKLYLEISGRNTGKTDRLIEEMVKHVRAGNDAILYIYSKHYKSSIHCKLIEKIESRAERDMIKKRIIIIYSKKQPEPDVTKLHNPRRFFDEWDYIEDCPFYPDGYYCTTLKRLRDKDATASDTLFGKLWRHHDKLVNHTTKYVHPGGVDRPADRGVIFEDQKEPAVGKVEKLVEEPTMKDVFGYKTRPEVLPNDIVWDGYDSDETNKVLAARFALDKFSYSIGLEQGHSFSHPSQIFWKTTGERFLWLYATNGDKVCLKNAEVNAFDDHVLVKIPRGSISKLNVTTNP